MTVPYVSPFFSEMLYARSSKNRLHSSTNPPLIPKIGGVKVQYSTSNTRSKYSRFLACSCLRNIFFVVWFLEELELTRVTLTSKNVSPFLQKRFAFMSNLDKLASRTLYLNLRASLNSSLLKSRFWSLTGTFVACLFYKWLQIFWKPFNSKRSTRGIILYIQIKSETNLSSIK